MSRKTTKKQLRSLEYHRNRIQVGVGQQVSESLERLEYDSALKAGVIAIAPETDTMADVLV